MFSWSNSSSGNKGRRTYPANRTTVAQPVSGSIRPPTYSRQQHLDSYLNDATLKPSTRRVSPDDSTYDTVFQTTSGDALILRVRLPSVPHSSAPCRAPTMTLVGVRASHAWIDSRMTIVGYDAIRNDAMWQSSGVTLGAAVNAVVRELQLQPPQILEITDPGLQRIQSNLAAGNNRGAAPTRSTPPRNTRTGSIRKIPQPEDPPDYESLNVPDIQLPDIPGTFPEVQSKSRDELQAILDDELEFLTLVHRLEYTKELQARSVSALEANATLAQTNLEKEQDMQELYGEVVQLQASLKEKVKEFQLLQNEQDQQCAPPDVNKLKRQLQKAKKEALDKSEQVAETWLDDGGDVDDFVETFLKERTIHHERAAKLERITAG